MEQASQQITKAGAANLYDTRIITHLTCKEVHFFHEPRGVNGKTIVETNNDSANVLHSLLRIFCVEFIPLTPYPELMLFEILNAGVARLRIVDRDMYEGPLGDLLAHYPHPDKECKYTGLQLREPWVIEPYANFAFWCSWRSLPTWVNLVAKVNFVGTKTLPIY